MHTPKAKHSSLHPTTTPLSRIGHSRETKGSSSRMKDSLLLEKYSNTKTKQLPVLLNTNKTSGNASPESLATTNLTNAVVHSLRRLVSMEVVLHLASTTCPTSTTRNYSNRKTMLGICRRAPLHRLRTLHPLPLPPLHLSPMLKERKSRTTTRLLLRHITRTPLFHSRVPLHLRRKKSTRRRCNKSSPRRTNSAKRRRMRRK
mmetsp:Transcript_34035/g.25119  ORF Transcript_34035/g.25119 Transcript_34035/m.25119 type:complete len:202 (-) Transcript_34035:850-1455(-)